MFDINIIMSKKNPSLMSLLWFFQYSDLKIFVQLIWMYSEIPVSYKFFDEYQAGKHQEIILEELIDVWMKNTAIS